MLAKAFIGNENVGHTFSFNPNSVQWSYNTEIQSIDTLGGRVVQLLSVNIDDMTVQGVAGSRKNLQTLGEDIAAIMKYHVKTQRPVYFKVPSRRWNFLVYVESLPQLGWDVQTVSYPFQITLRFEEDLLGTKTTQLRELELSRLNPDIGFNPNFHGGDATSFKEIVSKLRLDLNPAGGTAPTTTPTAPNGTPTNPGTNGQRFGSGLWSQKVATTPWSGSTLQQQIKNAWQSLFGSATANVAMCIVERESGFHPDAHNSYHDSNGGLHYVYGLYQISDVHSASPWWPKSGVFGLNGGLMYNAEYNVRCAMQIYSEQGWIPWSTHGSCGV